MKARSKPPWSRHIYSCGCCAFVEDIRESGNNDVMYMSNGNPCTSPVNGEFIATVGTLADLMLSVITAAEGAQYCMPGIPESDALQGALAALNAAIERMEST